MTCDLVYREDGKNLDGVPVYRLIASAVLSSQEEAITPFNEETEGTS
jgi:hypothetical protein